MTATEPNERNPNRREVVARRLWSKAIADGSGCWLWQGTIDGQGYGGLRGFSGRMEKAHRIAYELVRGPIPDGLVIDHLCRTRACINPRHLEAVSFRENVLRGTGATAEHARKTHCKHGHLFDRENTIIERDPARRYPRRRCRKCRQRIENARDRSAVVGEEVEVTG